MARPMNKGDRNPKLGLADAYAVRTVDDNRQLYRDWADSYETDFAEARGYVYHQGVADIYAEHQSDRLDAAVLDVGCGTGLVGTALSAHGIDTIDGVDLSAQMLAKARAKATYRDLLEVDVTKRLPFDDGTYGGVVSVGTFTHGHLGPEPLVELIRVAGSGAFFAIGINAEHYERDGFGGVLNDLVTSGVVEGFDHRTVPIYEAADDEWADDVALVATFRRHG